jgi:integrase
MFSHRKAVTVGGALDTYLADLAVAGRAKTTLELYRYLLGSLTRRVGPGRTLVSVRREDIVTFLGQVRERGTAQSYVNLTAHVTKGFLAWCVRQGYIVRNPMEGMVLPREHPQPRHPFTSDEVRRLIVAADTPLARAAVLLLLDTGMRASELAGLGLADVDFDSDTLTVHGKGAKVRLVALNEGPREALLAYLASRAQEDGRVWPERFDRKALAYLVDGIGHQAHVCPIFPHRFRNTFATNFLAATGNPLALQALLGHTTLDMVQRYVAAAQGDLALAVHRAHPMT